MADDDVTTEDAAAPEESTEPEVAPRELPAESMLASIVEGHPSATWTVAADEWVLQVVADEYHAAVVAAREAGFTTFIDLCGVDYFRARPRFEVVLTLVNYDEPMRLRIRTGVDGEVPRLPTVTDVFAGANFYERETYDLFGIEFTGHPDLTRILMPDDWEGYPLRKDYSVGSVPVQFKEANKVQ